MKLSSQECFRDCAVTVLCSGFGLGFYIPGILIRNNMRNRGVKAKSEVFESLIEASKLSALERSREAYHKDFKVALASQRIASDIRNSIDPMLLGSTIARWQAEDRRDFICLSGHWVHVLDVYRLRRPDIKLRVDLLHLDADASPSWKQIQKLVPDYALPYQVVQLYDVAHMRINYKIPTSINPPVPYKERNGRLVIHGGGWGIGTYQESTSELEAAGFDLDVVSYGQHATDTSASLTRRHFMEDPLWRTWHLDQDGDCGFPPPGILRTGTVETRVSTHSRHHSLHELIRSSAAIVSKPGAGTLIDSLGSCTPLVMLDPFGPHEEANAKVWSSFGFGVHYRDWAAAGYPVSILETIHSTLMERRGDIPDYVPAFIESAQEVMQ